MSRAESELLATEAATRLIHRYGLRGPRDIDLEEICFGEGVIAFEAPIKSADAWLVVKGNRGVARIRESIPYQGQKRFALAHELGHWMLHRQDAERFYDDSMTLAAYQRDPREIEASIFASELLVPTPILHQSIVRAETSIDYGLRIAAMFTVGPFVAMRKLLTMPGVNALLVVSDGEQMLYHKRSAKCTLYSPPAKRTIPNGATREAAKCVGKVCVGVTDASGWSEKARPGAPWHEEALKPDPDSPVITLLSWGR